MKECINYQKLHGGVVECQTCSHFCKIPEGRVGICGIRKNIQEKLYLLTYGKAVAVHIDPIEKKPLYHFLPESFAYSFGTLGCNFRCGNCQNYDISQMFGVKGKIKEYDKRQWGALLSPEEIVSEAKAKECLSIAYTYNEPTIFVEYALDTMKLAHAAGIKNIWVSNGFMSQQTLDAIIPYLDAINVDIKSFEEKFYRTNCGAQLQPVLDNSKQLVKEGVWVEITTLIVPTLSDDAKMLHQIATFIKKELGAEVPWHVSAFSGVISWKMQHLPDTSGEMIRNAYNIGKKVGLQYVYGGNVPGTEMENTLCPHCNALVIERVGYAITRYDKNGKCPSCSKAIAGVF